MSRLDVFLYGNGTVKSRERAKALIKSGKVRINGKVCTKPAFSVLDTDIVDAELDEFAYVGRGALKLETAFETFELDVEGLICADIGASTGGFTQCLLNRKARLVYAVDVGHGQLDASLAKDSRVVNMEGVNARNLTAADFEFQPQFISIDVSFISLELVIRPLYELLCDNGTIIALIKPQFEAGKQALNKSGIVKHEKDHVRVLEKLISLFEKTGLIIKDLIPSSVTGGDGNIEYLIWLVKGSDCDQKKHLNADLIVKKAFYEFK